MREIIMKRFIGVCRSVAVFAMLFATYSEAISQTVDEIKANNEFIWGEGKGNTLSEADREAIDQIVSQISVTVDSKFKKTIEENASKEVTEKVVFVMETYSNTTLDSTVRVVIQNEPDAHVLRYIKRADVYKIFTQRANKIQDFVRSAVNAEKDLRVADALKYYYWSLILLKSHPDGNELTTDGSNGPKTALAVWIPEQINRVLSKISFEAEKMKTSETEVLCKVTAKLDGKTVTNLDYSYWQGNDWSNLISCRDGVGMLEYNGAAATDVSRAKLRVEYVFRSETRIDKELESVMERIKDIPFRTSYVDVEVKENPAATAPVALPVAAPTVSIPAAMAALTTNETNTAATYTSKKPEMSSIVITNPDVEIAANVNTILNAIKTRKYVDAYPCFTPEGLEMYKQLVHYGDARLMDTTGMKYFNYMGKEIVVRPFKMAFSFKTNTRKFIENVVLHFDPATKKATEVSLGLTDVAVKSIWDNTAWSVYDRLIISEFLEGYQTAYALKRLGYIESIFADDALIITGNYTVVVDPESPFKESRVLQYNRYSKEEYIKKLRQSFTSKEFINLKFEDSYIRRSAEDSVYGIQIKQNYFSSNYGDVGYLFLLVDLRDPVKPIIHVRTWQPDRDKDGHIYGLEDF